MQIKATLGASLRESGADAPLSITDRSRVKLKPVRPRPGGAHDEAKQWFTEARRRLEEEGSRPLRAVCDFEEALMFARRAGPGDSDRACPLLAAARRQFDAIGMTGWLRRVDDLEAKLT